MTARAPAMRRELDHLIDENINLLNRKSALTSHQIDEYFERSARIKVLRADLDRTKPVPNYTVLKQAYPSPTI
jgi:hypothetical protein